MRVELYVCDRCGAEHKTPRELLKVNVLEGTGRRGPSKASGPVVELCPSCVKDLRKWVETGKPRRKMAGNGAPEAATEAPRELVAA